MQGSFYNVIREIEQAIDRFNEAIGKALKQARFDEARAAVAHVEKFVELKLRAQQLAEEWEHLLATAPLPVTVPVARRGSRRSRSAPRETQQRVQRAILEALMELGGQADHRKVLEIVEQKVADLLTEHDYEVLTNGETRWRNNARWLRHRLIQEGLMERNSPRGVWAISEAGRKALESGRV
ncbi:MAG: hypothetical protein KatS3mg077_1360 [Candidatus Binatia bacterium]|nr:MAG: hypothetical protein KatS3mg077_1360 [Candidatus Binatia bacterium]